MREVLRRLERSAVVYVAVATRAFRRYATYRGATLAGVFTNCVFGVIICYVYLAVWANNPRAGGYDAADAVTYAWLGQAMLMTIALFGGGPTDELADRVRSGEIASDFSRPTSLLGWYAAADLGRAAYHLLGRGVAPTLLGAALFDLRWPGGAAAWAAFAVSLPLAVLVSFALRFLVAVSAFWLLDDTGVRTLNMAAAIFFSGMTVPLVLFPGALRDVAMALPWVAFLQVPADLWLGQRSGSEALAGLALQAGWAVALLSACAWLLRAAERRLVVQGG